MKITNIAASPIKLHMKQPFVITNGKFYDLYFVLVKIQTDEGIIGYGEAIPAWEVTGETAKSVIGCVELFTNTSLLGISLIGQDISSLEKVESTISILYPENSPSFVHGNASAKAAIEQAILDAYGKYISKPIYEIYGGTRKPIPFTKNISIHPIEETLQEVQKGIDENFGIIRLKIGLEHYEGKASYERDIEVIYQAKKMIRKSQKNITLVADANQGLRDVSTSIAFCREIEGCLGWLEQPILADNIEGFLELKKHVAIPLMADESLISPYAVRFLVMNNAVDYINIKLMKSGGIVQARKIIQFAREYNIKCQIGSMFGSIVGESMGCQLYMIENDIISTDLNSFDLLKNQIATGLEIHNNKIYVSDQPGCGIQLL